MQLHHRQVNEGLHTVGNMTDARYQHAAVRVPETQHVIVFGGQGTNGQALASAEQLNYTTQNWTTTVRFKF